jgi:lysophospholipase L1-like esterase
MKKKILWYSILSLSLISFSVMSLGVVKAFSVTGLKDPVVIEPEYPSQDAANTPNRQDSSITIVSLGDSLAKGTGDENNKGFSGYFSDYLRDSTKRPVDYTNIAIDGLVSEQLLKQLESENVRSLVKDADIIMLSIGGNNVRSIASVQAEIGLHSLSDIQQSYIRDVKAIIEDIRQLNPSCYIVFMGLYNPYNLEQFTEVLDYLHNWNYILQQVIDKDDRSLFVPTYDLFKWNTKSFICHDGLHPNSLGYKAVAQRMFSSVENIYK